MEINNKGLSIIEIIITIAILGMVAILFVQIFTVSFQHIMTAGEDSKNLIEDQMDIEAVIDSDGPGVLTSIDFSTVFSGVSGDVEGALVNHGAFQSFLPGVTESIVFVTDMTLSSYNVTFYDINDVINIIATFTPAESTNQEVTWISNDESVVIVQNGLLSAKSLGSTTVTAIADGTEEGVTVIKTVNVTVTSDIAEDLLLETITIGNGPSKVEIDNFVPTNFSYTIVVTNTGTPQIDFELKDNTSTADYDPPKFNQNDYTGTITVTSDDSGDSNTYTLTFIVQN